MSFNDLYRSKCLGAADAIGLVKDGDHIVVPTGVAEPPRLLEALSEQRRSLRNVAVCQVLAMQKYGYFDPETVEHVRHSAWFLGAGSRKGAQQGWVDILPTHFSDIPVLIDRGFAPSDVLFSLASPMDPAGWFALSLGTDYAMAAAKKARVIVLESNPNVPFAHGNCHIHISQVTAVVQDERPIFEVGLPAIGPVQQAIGGYVADMISDGDTIQIGYGAIPDAVVIQLTDKKDLGVHTEMIGDGIVSLIEAGVVTNRKKNFYPGKTLATFALGSKRLYQFMHRNPSIQMHPVDFTNDPAIVGNNDNFIAINGTMQVDFYGQCCSESQGVLPYSGTGGQSDFVRSAARSVGGKAVIVCPSTAKNDTISRIVPTLSPGAQVSTSKNDVDYVVTEYGVAHLRGRNLRERTKALIGIAHPNFRDELMEEAKKMRVL